MAKASKQALRRAISNLLSIGLTSFIIFRSVNLQS
jgi:hypothetical protein